MRCVRRKKVGQAPDVDIAHRTGAVQIAYLMNGREPENTNFVGE